MTDPRRPKASPECDRVKAALLGGIAERRWAPGSRLPPERELVREFGVSRLTLRKALAELGCFEQLQGCGTFYRPKAQRTVPVGAKQTQVIDSVLMVCRATRPFVEDNAFLMELLGGLNLRLKARNGVVQVLSLNNEQAFSDVCEHVTLQPRQGVLFVAYAPADSEIRYLRQRQMPVAVVGRPEGGEPVSSVESDDVAGAGVAVRHLIELGHRRIALLSGPDGHDFVDRIRAGYTLALQEAGISVDDRLLQSTTCWDREIGADGMRKLLACGGFSAVITQGDWSSYGAFEVLQSHGIEIPNRVSFLVYDWYRWLSRTVPQRLTHVWVDRRRLAEAAVEALDADGIGLPPREWWVRPELVACDSTGIATDGIQAPI